MDTDMAGGRIRSVGGVASPQHDSIGHLNQQTPVFAEPSQREEKSAGDKRCWGVVSFGTACAALVFPATATADNKSGGGKSFRKNEGQQEEWDLAVLGGRVLGSKMESAEELKQEKTRRKRIWMGLAVGLIVLAAIVVRAQSVLRINPYADVACELSAFMPKIKQKLNQQFFFQLSEIFYDCQFFSLVEPFAIYSGMCSLSLTKRIICLYTTCK
jgi:hypothetical protein